MSCCCRPQAGLATGRFFSFFARSYRKRFAKKGLEPSQRQLMAGVCAQGIDGRSVIEVGCGVGYFHFLLLEAGATRAVGVDLSAQMIAQAKAFASERGHAERTSYHVGDFVVLADVVEPADVTVLDKVVCCYPDPRALVTASTQKTKHMYALTIPRGHWWARASFACARALLWMVRSGFRPYVHDPLAIERNVVAQGFVKRHQCETVFWLTQVYERAAASPEARRV